MRKIVTKKPVVWQTTEEEEEPHLIMEREWVKPIPYHPCNGLL